MIYHPIAFLVLATAFTSLFGLNVAAAKQVVSILKPADIVDSVGVELKVQVPQQGPMLYKRGANNSVHQTPMASRTLKDGTVQLWYLRVDYSQVDVADQLVLCLGEIRDGAWTLPNVNHDPVPWGGPNNIVMTRSQYPPTWGGFNPFQIVSGASGLEMLYWDQPDVAGKAGGMRANSSDGVMWRKVPHAVFTEFNDAFTLMRVGTVDRLYQTGLLPWPDKPIPDSLYAYRRIIYLRTSTDDLATWTPIDLARPMLAPDDKDSVEAEFYCFKAFRYGDSYAGILWKYYADPARLKEHSRIFRYELVVSDDGLDWQRPFRDMDIGFWSYADPFVQNDRLWFVTQGGPGQTKSGSTLLKGWETDRMVAVEGKGSFRTRAFARPAGTLSVDADASHGWIEITPCDDKGIPIPKLESIRIADDAGQLPLPWKENQLPANMSLSVKMSDAKVFGVSSSETP